MGKKKILVLVAFLNLIYACATSIQYQIPPYQGTKPEPEKKIPLSIGLYFHPILPGTELKNTTCDSEYKLFHVPCGQITVSKSIQAFNLIFNRVELIDFPGVFERIEQIKQKKLDLLVELKLIRHDQLHYPKKFFRSHIVPYHAEYEIGVTFFNSEGKIIWEGSENYVTQETKFDPYFGTKDSLLKVSDQVSMAVDGCLSKIISNLETAPVMTNIYMSKRIETEKRTETIIKEQPQESPPSKKEKTKEILTGTGFPISKDLVVTAAHIVAGATDIIAYKDNLSIPMDCKILLVDDVNDIAILSVNREFSEHEVLVMSERFDIGEEVYTVGYPLIGVLGSKPRYSQGNISATFGIGDDPRILQITVPVQPGNSGGPLLNKDGFVIGMIVSKLDDIALLKISGSIPQNINFAIKSGYISILAKNSGVSIKLPKTTKPKSIDDVSKSVVIIAVTK